MTSVALRSLNTESLPLNARPVNLTYHLPLSSFTIVGSGPAEFAGPFPWCDAGLVPRCTSYAGL
jgi:hypothetical protein